MLKKIQYFFIAFFPYYILFVFYCLLKGYFGLNLLISIGIFYSAALISSISAFVVSFSKSNSVSTLLQANMMIKMIHIPAYVMLFILGMLSTITIFTIGLSVVIIVLDILIIFLSGMVGLGGILRSLKEEKLSNKEAVRHGILQFIFCLDVFSAVKIYRNAQREAIVQK